LIGALGYHKIENMSPLDSLYMAIITLSTVGYKEVYPLSDTGKVFTIIFIITGIAFVSYTVFTVGELLFETTFNNLLSRRGKEIKMDGHYIVCGFGKIGSIVTKELQAKKEKVIVIEKDPERIRLLREKEIPYIEGDATEEETLLKANIGKAKGIACTLTEDADNLYVTLTARELNPNIVIVSRAENEASVKKLIKAGANKVITPYEAGAIKIAEYLRKKEILEIVDFIINAEPLQYAIKQLALEKSHPLINKTLREAGLRQKYGILVIGIIRGDKTIINPSPDEILRENDILVVIGEAGKLTTQNL
ncbi:MAG: potassium channel protein, partial [bacterium]|nr:potassium channel protein [bacterium]